MHLSQGPQSLNHATYPTLIFPHTACFSTTRLSASHKSSRFIVDKDLATNNVLGLGDVFKTFLTLTMASFNLSHQTTDSTNPSVPVSISDKPGPPPVHPRSTRLSKSLRSPISLAHTSYIVILCCFFTGLLDSLSSTPTVPSSPARQETLSFSVSAPQHLTRQHVHTGGRKA